MGIFENLYMIGGMFFVYALARLVNYWRLCCEDDKRKSVITLILGIIYIILCLLSFPVSLIMYGINYIYDGRAKQLHTKEMLQKSNEEYNYLKQNKIISLEVKITELEQENVRLRKRASEEMRHGYELGQKRIEEIRQSEYTTGFIDGFEQCLDYTYYSDTEKDHLRSKLREDVLPSPENK